MCDGFVILALSFTYNRRISARIHWFELVHLQRFFTDLFYIPLQLHRFNGQWCFYRQCGNRTNGNCHYPNQYYFGGFCDFYGDRYEYIWLFDDNTCLWSIIRNYSNYIYWRGYGRLAGFNYFFDFWNRHLLGFCAYPSRL